MNIRIRNNSIAFGLETAISPFPGLIRAILVVWDPHNDGRRLSKRKIM